MARLSGGSYLQEEDRRARGIKLGGWASGHADT